MENWKRNGQILLGHLAIMNPCPFFFGIEFTQSHVKCQCLIQEIVLYCHSIEGLFLKKIVSFFPKTF